MEGCFTPQWGICFSDGGGFIPKWEDAPWGRGIGSDGGGVRKNRRMGRHLPPMPPNYGKPCSFPAKQVLDEEVLKDAI